MTPKNTRPSTTRHLWNSLWSPSPCFIHRTSYFEVLRTASHPLSTMSSSSEASSEPAHFEPDVDSDDQSVKIREEGRFRIFHVRTCLVCLCEESKIIFFPCLHQCTCVTCGRAVIEHSCYCPFCRQDINFFAYCDQFKYRQAEEPGAQKPPMKLIQVPTNGRSTWTTG